MNTYETLRRFYARLVTATAGVREPSIVDAFERVAREQFVGSGPWHIQIAGGYMLSGTDDPAVLYQDINIGLAPEQGVNNGEPSLHARCMGAVAARPGDVVIHVGAGSGYYTAILAHLVGPSGRVHAYEIEVDMARRAVENLSKHTTVTVYARSGLGSPLPSANIIYVSAGATHVPGEWLDALAPRGRLVLPLTPNERLGCMLLVTRQFAAAYAARVLSPAAFIPCVGARDDSQSRALAAALDTRSPDGIRSLRRGCEPDETAWCIGSGWWLSTAEPVGSGA